MTRIITGGGPAGSKIVGRPGGYHGLKKTGLITRGNKIKKITQQNVRTLVAHDPSKRTSRKVFHTSKDVLGDTNQRWNRANVRMRDSNQAKPFGIRRLKVAPGTRDQGNATRETRMPSVDYTNRKIVKR
jgi:hypothetical protein